MSTRTFDRIIAGDVVASSDKSIVNAPAGYYDNLSGCLADVDQYARYTAPLTINRRLNCSSPFPSLQASLSGVGIRAGKLTGDLADFDGDGSAFNAGQLYQLLTPSNIPTWGVGGLTGATTQQRGSTYAIRGLAGDILVNRSISTPRVVQIIDQCGSVAGHKFSVSMNQSVLDPATCKPIFTGSATLSIYHEIVVAPTPTPVEGADNAAVVIPYLQSVSSLALTSTAAADAIGPLVAALAVSTWSGDTVVLPLPV